MNPGPVAFGPQRLSSSPQMTFADEANVIITYKINIVVIVVDVFNVFNVFVMFKNCKCKFLNFIITDAVRVYFLADQSQVDHKSEQVNHQPEAN